MLHQDCSESCDWGANRNRCSNLGTEKLPRIVAIRQNIQQKTQLPVPNQNPRRSALRFPHTYRRDVRRYDTPIGYNNTGLQCQRVVAVVSLFTFGYNGI